jgi:hypothetical protein
MANPTSLEQLNAVLNALILRNGKEKMDLLGTVTPNTFCDSCTYDDYTPRACPCCNPARKDEDKQLRYIL